LTALLNDSERVAECPSTACAFASQPQGRCEGEHGHAGRPRGCRHWECLCTAVPGDRLPAIQLRRALTRPLLSQHRHGQLGRVIRRPSKCVQCACHVCTDNVNQIPLLSPLLNTPLAVDTDTRLSQSLLDAVSRRHSGTAPHVQAPLPANKRAALDHPCQHYLAGCIVLLTSPDAVAPVD
jgi:hypothetical protein